MSQKGLIYQIRSFIVETHKIYILKQLLGDDRI